MTSGEQLITVREAARICHRSEETIRRWIWSGKLPARKLGNQLFVTDGDLLRVQPAARVSEAPVAYSVRAAKRGNLEGREPMDEVTARLFRAYDYSPMMEDLRSHRGQIRPSREEQLTQIQEDEAFQDEVRERFGPVDVVELLRQVREG